jgi:hypothetical protein
MAKLTIFPSPELPAPVTPTITFTEFEQLFKHVRAALSKEELATVTVKNVENLQIRYDQILTEAQAINRLKASLQTAAGGGGLTPQQAMDLLALLQILQP